MSNFKESEFQAVSSASTSQDAVQSIAQLDKPGNCVKVHEEWHMLTCIRACEGDHAAALVLYKLMYWWPKKRTGQKGVKKSVSDWEAELMLSEKPVKRINALLIRLGLVEIYKAPWGHFKSESTFYTLTAKALTLLKAPLPKAPLPTGGMVSKAPLPTGVITIEDLKPTKEKEKTKAVGEKTPTFSGESQTQPGEVVTPEEPGKEPLKMYDIWKTNVLKNFPGNYLEPKARDIKNLGPKMRRLYRSGVTDYLAVLEWVTSAEGFDTVRFEWDGIWDGQVNKLANPPQWPDLAFLLNERNLAVTVAIYRHVHGQSAEQQAAEAAKEDQEYAAWLAEHEASKAAYKAKVQASLAKYEAEDDAAANAAKVVKVAEPADDFLGALVEAKKMNKFAQHLADEHAAKASEPATPTTSEPAPVVEPVVSQSHFLTADDYEDCQEPPSDYPKAPLTQQQLLAAVKAKELARLAAKNKATMFQHGKPKGGKASHTAT